jgi:hypothetical protein
MALTIGYAGSEGHHFARLVNQDFLYSTVNSPVYAAYFAQTDSNQSYNGLNVQLNRDFTHSLSFRVNYTYAKALDQVSNGDSADSNANQTDPAHNETEWGPSDYNLKHRITITGLYELPHLHSGNNVVKTAVNGWKVNGIVTYHTGFPWTPVTYNLTTTANQLGSGVVSPTRPLAYYGGAGRSCSTDAFKNGTNFSKGGPAYFDITSPSNTATYVPGIGRNSFNGPCYFDTDISMSREARFESLGHHATVKFQANFFNAFNKLQLQPITNGNANPGANIQNSTFGYAQGADAGRQIEFITRIQF